MRALTIQQPFASMIVSDADDLPGCCVPRRCENRNWPTEFRGTFLIHAGRSTVNLAPQVCQLGRSEVLWDAVEYPVALGAFIGTAHLYDCFHIDQIESRLTEMPWLASNQHVGGRFCFILRNVRRFQVPISCKGQLGWFDVADSLVRDAINLSVRPKVKPSPFMLRLR